MHRFSFLSVIFSAAALYAGPPYLTDDPDPVDPGHFEVNVAVIANRSHDGSEGSLPRIELNYGAMENLQLGIATPIVFDDPRGENTHVGLGDLQLSAKYRFLPEAPDRPMVAFFPSITLPTGDDDRGLGAGKLTLLLPLWFQKSWDDDKWTTFGGGGWVYNPVGRNYWVTGWAIQRQVTEKLAIGGELFFQTADGADAEDVLSGNLACVYDVSDLLHLHLSVGKDLSGPSQIFTYVGIQLTW